MDMKRAWARPVAQLVGLGVLLAALIGLTAGPADAATHPATQVKVLRAVTPSGHAARGWKVVKDNRPAVTCGYQSAVGVSPDIDSCGSTADNLPACWKSSTRSRVLCTDAVDALHKTLRSVRYTGRYGYREYDGQTIPLAMHLRDGMTMDVRIGGAWDRIAQHPHWVGWYYQQGTFAHTVYGQRNVPGGIYAPSPAYYVHVYGNPNKPGFVAYVGTEYYVGTTR